MHTSTPCKAVYLITVLGLGCRLRLGDQAEPGSTAEEAAAGRQQPAGAGATNAQQQADSGLGAHSRSSDAGHSGVEAPSHSADSKAADGIDNRHAHDHHHLHADQVTSVSLRLSGPLDLQRCAICPRRGAMTQLPMMSSSALGMSPRDW